MSSEGLPTPYAEDVLDLVAQVPPGSAVAYGDLARMLGRGGPRQVGTVMARFGGGVPWWRVVRADGTPAPQLAGEALRRLRRDGTPLVGGVRVDLAACRWPGPAASRTAWVSDPTGEVDP